MACQGCGQARQQFFQAVRHFNPRAAVSAVHTAVQINMDKLAGMKPVDIDRKYGGGSKRPVVRAAPYKRTT